MVVLSGSMIAQRPSSSIARFGGLNQPSFFSDGDVLKSLALQKTIDCTLSKMFPSAEDLASCADAITLSRELRPNFCHCISEKLKNRKRKARNLLCYIDWVLYPAFLANITFQR